MALDEKIISKAIIENFCRELIENLNVDVVVVGAGPAGLVCSYYLAKANLKTIVFERTLRPGGGIAGGGMMFNKIVVQQSALEILDELAIRYQKYYQDYYVADALEALGMLLAQTIKAGSKVYNLITVEDIMIRAEKITGVVINWSAVEMAKLHVDPLVVQSNYVVDATGHAAEIARIVERKIGPKLFTDTGNCIGEKPMWAEVAEDLILENTKEAYYNLFVAGMAANTVFGAPRMGPIFGGMFLSGRKAAQLIIQKAQSK
ncbi:MAG: sulfide-dependent adenosine diphosphate thiazole synthase [candidate division WOR-3 bacterium]|nr:sulfide-dependent adenosine diphosphate thiazole synthase [candidate division WOR-3 bacterium]MCX7757832.1 sulfide-dependent adenosine diphosphate thiazole synthase [candidate division WOR-3 bacterium]MDW7988367.1 sulfide-dependent adenosine diphosphate thiazole synthase [candidate division WOR-3 bacterium]